MTYLSIKIIIIVRHYLSDNKLVKLELRLKSLAFVSQKYVNTYSMENLKT